MAKTAGAAKATQVAKRPKNDSGGGVTGEKIWLDGEFVDWDAARVHILTHTLH